MPQKNTTISLQDLAAIRGGTCVEKYTTSRAKVEWKCANEHTWIASVNNVLHNNSWCPHCKIGLSESICKLYFETIFNENFIKIRPKWLINENGNRLELDGYCAKLGIAFEHNGEQHYSDNNPWKKDLLVRQSWDETKIQLCAVNGVKLIVIPQLFSRLKLSNLKEFLKRELLYNNISLPNNYDQIVFDLSKIKEPVSFTEYKLIAEHKGGKCLSLEYKSCHKKLLWECKEKHIWWAVPYTIKTGSWCPACAGRPNITIDQVMDLVNSKNGLLLSNSYINNSTKMEIKCNVCDNVWMMSLDKIKRGQWCPNCAKKKQTGRPKGKM